MSKGDKPKYIARAGTAEDNDYMLFLPEEVRK